jgi:hypothetical protein
MWVSFRSDAIRFPNRSARNLSRHRGAFARRFDGLEDWFRRSRSILREDRRYLFQPTVWRSGGMANAHFVVIPCAPYDPVAADVIEQEEAGAESGGPDLAVPHEEPAGHLAGLAISSAGYFDAIVLVG